MNTELSRRMKMQYRISWKSAGKAPGKEGGRAGSRHPADQKIQGLKFETGARIYGYDPYRASEMDGLDPPIRASRRRNGSKVTIGLRNIICLVQKENKGWWKRLLKSEEKPAPYIKVDWNKWCDEDEEESKSDSVASDDDYDGENGNDDWSSDDDGLLYLPDLEKARGK